MLESYLKKDLKGNIYLISDKLWTKSPYTNQISTSGHNIVVEGEPKMEKVPKCKCFIKFKIGIFQLRHINNIVRPLKCRDQSFLDAI